MIVFDLACGCGYTFEGWFHDRRDFEDQSAASLLACPQCGSGEIRKILSPVLFRSAAPEKGSSGDPCTTAGPVTPEDAGQALATLQRFVAENFEDVGADLAKEALKMRYGMTEPRNIRGVASEPEEEKLREEGIDLLKIPMPVNGEKTN